MKGENAFAIMAAWRRSARRAGLSEAEIKAKLDEAKSGDYAHLCKTLGV